MSQLELNKVENNEKALLFANVLLPVPIVNSYTYRIPSELEPRVTIGSRVIVEFGRNKILTGVIATIHRTAPEVYKAKYLLEVLDDFPIIQPIQFKIFKWISDYYMCTEGEVLNAALPSGLKLSSLSIVQLHPEFEVNKYIQQLSDKELKVVEVLEKGGTLTYDEIAGLLQVKSIYPTLKGLIKIQAILIFEKVIEKYKPKKVARIRLNNRYVVQPELLEDLFEKLEKKPKQTDLLLKYLQLVPIYHQPEKNQSGIEKQTFNQPDLSPSSLKTLLKNGVFEAFDEIVSRFDENEFRSTANQIELSDDQEIAKHELLRSFEKKDIALLHGITGSGKTELYIDLIQRHLENGNQVLFLLPEIALTTQIVKRLLKVFGSEMGVFHSKYSDNERVEIWNGVISGRYSLVVGVRSAVFLPFHNLGLIIVDEEHELSYKQFESAPRYHARDLSLVIAKFHKAKVLLGSATPSIETFTHAKSGKYGLVTMDKRFGGSQLPTFRLINVLKAKQNKTMHEDFSEELLLAIQERIERKEQVIIFQNRRGYAPYLACDDCNWIPKCENCAVSLTYHMYINLLKCHYCGHKEKPPVLCPACGSTKLQMVGFGTEKLEEDLKNMIPSARIRRMDLDTTRSKYSYQTIINEFEQGEIDILVGTQMLSKGLDFDKVSMVGILDIDRMMHFPDFRSMERSFQLVTQVSGRAGRRKTKGEVFIQTAQPDHPLINKIKQHRYEEMYEEEMIERHRFQYPPFVRLINLIIKHKDKKLCQQASTYLHSILAAKLGKKRTFGPVEPVISRIRNQYLMEILLKIERDGIHLGKVKEAIRQCVQNIQTDKQFKGVRIVIDVDNY